MRLQVKELVIGLVVLAASAAAQTTVTTTGGTANSVAKFFGGSAIVGSAITESDGNVGIGVTQLDVNGVGRFNQLGLGPSGWIQQNGNTDFRIFASSGVPLTLGANGNINQLYISTTGKIGIGTPLPFQQLTVRRDDRLNALAITGSTGEQLILLGNQDYQGANNPYAIKSANGNLWFGHGTSWSDPIGGTFSANVTFLNNGNVGIGMTTPSAKLEVNGDVKLSGLDAKLEVAGNVKLSGGGGSITFPDNSVQSTAWNGTLCGGDYAESVEVSGDRSEVEPGDLLRIDDDDPSHFLKTVEPYSQAVAGVYSTKPGVVGRRQTTPKDPNEVPLAMVGIVPVKASAENGPIRPHDLLVSSSKAGYAMKGTDRGRMLGAVIGKAMGTLESGTGVIEVLVSLQ